MQYCIVSINTHKTLTYTVVSIDTGERKGPTVSTLRVFPVLKKHSTSNVPANQAIVCQVHSIHLMPQARQDVGAFNVGVNIPWFVKKLKDLQLQDGVEKERLEESLIKEPNLYKGHHSYPQK